MEHTLTELQRNESNVDMPELCLKESNAEMVELVH